MQEFSDGVILVENDEIEQICKKVLGIQRSGVDEMNKIIAGMLQSILWPVLNNKDERIYSLYQN